MLEQNNEKEEIISEAENVEVEETKVVEETEAIEDVKAESPKVEEVKKVDSFKSRSFISALGVSVIDTIITTAIAMLIFLVSKPVLKGLGYKIVANKEYGVVAILLVVSALCYYTICRCVKNGKTLGEAIL
ncbi:transporter [Clostridium cellulovorans]|uniref:RDD domain containing protein n=1 Tax=Clostridium cellulovorans (strain ATCC 35296 / DSM 3052 / OCM 3 / 743B) TaxID=573061 RepID=D9SRD1_CLOC7|nr:transporter [Clostridium cellulovorans]ADL52360.1 RDD domain containing protein [Clostridium cellulovorans 743B]